MKIRIHKKMLVEPKWFSYLDTLSLFLETDRHGLDPLQLIEVVASPWLSKRSLSDREMVKASALKSSNNAFSDGSIVFIDPERSGEIIFDRENQKTISGPFDALHLLSTPLQVVVENEFNDGNFLLWVGKAIGNYRFLKYYRDGFFTFRHAGGKDSVERCSRSFSLGVWHREEENVARDMTMFVTAIIDSDCRFPGDNPNASIINQLSDAVVYSHCLRKRAIENYIPLEFIERRFKKSRETLKKVRSLKALSKDQRRCYNMKSGFKFPTKASFMASQENHPLAKALFEDINDKCWSDLARGYGKDLSNIFRDKELRPDWNDSRFSDQDDRAELQTVINRLLTLL